MTTPPPEWDEDFRPPGLDHLLKAVKGRRGPGPDFEVVPTPETPKPRRQALSVRRILILLAIGCGVLAVSAFAARLILGQ